MRGGIEIEGLVIGKAVLLPLRFSKDHSVLFVGVSRKRGEMCSSRKFLPVFKLESRLRETGTEGQIHLRLLTAGLSRSEPAVERACVR